MKLNKKKLNIILSQIKAHQNVALIKGNPESPGLIDIIFQPKSKDVELGYLNKLTCNMAEGDDIFPDTSIESLDKEFIINVSRLRDALKGKISEPEFVDGIVNGIDIRSTDDSKVALQNQFIKQTWKDIQNIAQNFEATARFVTPNIDYELMADTVSQFVSHDPTRAFMSGFSVDFRKGEDFINFVATDGKRLAICKFPCLHPKMVDEKDSHVGEFTLKPICLFKPTSAYSKTQWMIGKQAACISIVTDDYSIDCWARPIDGQFPNYVRVIPSREDASDYMVINAHNVRNAFASVKGLINNSGYSYLKNQIFLNAEDPKRVKLTVTGASIDIDGEASRPMCLRFNWDLFNSTLFNTSYTKLWIQAVDKAAFAEENRAVKGTSLSILKVVMPMQREDDTDEWGIAHVTHKQESASKNDIEDDIESENDIANDEDDEDSTIKYGEEF
jgi:DNA polymerase III sliding clamp (beta) subunit (PCNA family)